MDLYRIVDAWRAAPDFTEFGPPLPPGAIEGAEEQLGRRLPTDLARLYLVSNGMSVLGGDLSIAPLGPDEGDVPRLSDDLRGWGWPIPPELLVFGADGGGDPVGLWYPDSANPDGPMLVVHVGQLFEPACMAVVGTDLATFLHTWSAIYLVASEAPADALDVLDVPMALRAEPADGDVAAYYRWSDPGLPDPAPDPYTRPLDTAGVVAVLAAL